ELQFDVKAGFLVVAALVGNEARRVAGKADDADIDLGAGARGKAETGQGGRSGKAHQGLAAAKRESHQVVSFPRVLDCSLRGSARPSTNVARISRRFRRTRTQFFQPFGEKAVGFATVYAR